MQPDGYDEEMPDENTAIESVLGDNPRATELQAMISALETRKRAVLREADRSRFASERIKLEAKLGEIDIQLKALREELAITTFVENSVRVTISRNPNVMDDDEEY